jgi:hypothetical protein
MVGMKFSARENPGNFDITRDPNDHVRSIYPRLRDGLYPVTSTETGSCAAIRAVVFPNEPNRGFEFISLRQPVVQNALSPDRVRQALKPASRVLEEFWEPPTR